MIERGVILPLSDLMDVVRDEYVRLVKEEGVFIPAEQKGEAKSLLNTGLNQAISSVQVYHSDIAPTLKPIAAEISITSDIGLSLPLSGRLDLVEFGRVRDLKIRNSKRSIESARADLQHLVYDELYKAQYGEYPAEHIYDEIVPLKTKCDYIPLTIEHSEHFFNRLKGYCLAFIRDLIAGIFRPCDPNHWQCTKDYCGYWTTCVYSRGRVAA